MTAAFDCTYDSEIVTLTPPGMSKPVHLRYPTFAEWMTLVHDHQGLDKKTPPAETVARTIATCLCDEGGKPVGKDVTASVLKASPRVVMWLYQRCWETVLRSDDETIKEKEKN